jgi:hypothetical protein
MKKMYNIDDLKMQELDKLVELFVLVWNENPNNVRNKTEWAFKNSFSKNIVSRNEKKELNGARGGIQWPLVFQDKEIKCYQFHGTCVHPDYRRQGLFSLLNKEFLKAAKSDGYEFIFNVSVTASRLGYEKLGWKYLKGFHRLTKIHLKNLSSKNVYSVNSDDSIKDVIPEVFFQKRESQFQNLIHTCYNNDFLSWRLKNASANYKLYITDHAVVVYKTQIKNDKKELIIGEVFLIEGKYFEFSKTMTKLIKKEKPFLSYTYIYDTHPFYSFYLRYFFLPNPFHYHLHFGTKILNDELTLLNEKWGISFLDIDTF